jgi:glycosyltransferase involved in cell wall biosynthesis
VGEYAKHFKADVVLSLYDMFPLNEQTREDIGVPWIAWVPIDGVPVPDRVVASTKKVDWVLSMTRFGQEELAKAGIASEYVPLGIDCDAYCPGDRAEARRDLGFPEDAFIVGVVAANKGWPSRKSWPELMGGFAQFHRRFSRNTILYLHTTATPYGTREGANIPMLRKRLGLPQNVVNMTAEADIAIGIQPDVMAQLYRAFDVLLSPSMGEGFGLPIVEAQACGTPVITQDCTAMTENTLLGQCITPLQQFYVPQLNYYWYLAAAPGGLPRQAGRAGDDAGSPQDTAEIPLAGPVRAEVEAVPGESRGGAMVEEFAVLTISFAIGILVGMGTAWWRLLLPVIGLFTWIAVRLVERHERNSV